MEIRTKKQNEQQKATKSIFHSHFHSFAPILDLWKVVHIKSNEKPEREKNDGQRKAVRSSKKLQRATKGNNGHRSWKSQNRQEKTKTSNERHKKSRWKPGFTDVVTWIWSLVLVKSPLKLVVNFKRVLKDVKHSQNFKLREKTYKSFHVIGQASRLQEQSISEFECQCKFGGNHDVNLNLVPGSLEVGVAVEAS